MLLITLFGTHSRAAQQQHIALQRHVFQQNLASSSVLQHSQITHQKGIVIPCGGARQLASAYVTLLMIRNYFSCNLPVEVAYYGSHEMDDCHEALFQVGTQLLAADSATIDSAVTIHSSGSVCRLLVLLCWWICLRSPVWSTKQNFL